MSIQTELTRIINAKAAIKAAIEGKGVTVPAGTLLDGMAVWNDIPYRDGYRIIPETITVTTAFSEGEYGWWGNELYRSKVNSNVYTPAVYPDNWEKIK